jgi:phage shock protein PspC (stress-responsive transcriptional regulator)
VNHDDHRAHDTAPLGCAAHARHRHPIIGGVAAYLARHLGLPVLWVRAGFLVAAVLGGSGIMFYAGPWLVLPGDSTSRRAGARERGEAGRRGRIRRLADSGPAIALVALGVGMVFTAEAIFGNGIVIWGSCSRSRPACCGVRPTRRSARWLDQSEKLNSARAVFGGGGWAAYVRVGAGFVLVISAVALFAVRHGRVSDVYDADLCRARRRRSRHHPRTLDLAAHQRPHGRAAGACAPRSGPTSPLTCTIRSYRRSP